ncbi:MAG: hypothetical protein AAB558_04370 [Patescibacteria group bacterium]
MTSPISDLERRAVLGEAKALTELSHRTEQATNDSECEAYVDAFDRVAMLYAMGRFDANEWQAFKAVVKKQNEMVVHVDEAEWNNEVVERMQFEMLVLEKMMQQDLVSDRATHEREVLPSIMQMFISDAERAAIEEEYCRRWIEAARACLTSPRFLELPDDVFYELLEVVAYKLEDDEDVQCPDCGSTEVETISD